MSLMQQLYQVLVGAQTEIVIFIIAFTLHHTLFGAHGIKGKGKRGRGSEQRQLSQDGGARAAQSREAGALVRAVRALQREEQGWEAIAAELQEQLRKHKNEDVAPALATFLEGLGRSASPATLKAVSEERTRLGLKGYSRLTEVLLRGYLGTDSWESFRELLAEAEAMGNPSPGVSVMALRAAVRASDLDAALRPLGQLAGLMQDTAGTTASAAPHQLVQQTIQLALEKAALDRLLAELATSGLVAPWVVEVLLRECARAKDVAGLKAAEELARQRGMELTATSYAILIREASEPADSQRLLREALAASGDRAQPLAAAAELAAATGDAALAGLVLEGFKEGPSPPAACALIRLAADGILLGEDRDAALLELYKKHLQGSRVLAELRSVPVRTLAEAVLRSRDFGTLRQLLSVAGENFRPAILLKSLGEDFRVEDALAVFDCCHEKSPMLYNALLDVLISAKDMQTAERMMEKAIAAGLADVVTYNTIIKAHVLNGDVRRARAAIETMRRAGHAPNHVTFNELLDVQLKADRESAWDLLAEMRVCGVPPNHVTCSILLKSVGSNTREADIRRILDVVASLEGDMDEVLLSSLCEACVRVRRVDLLQKFLRRQKGPHGVVVTGAYTYGSLIRAHGFLHDLDGVWAAWREMRGKNIVPTSTTLGCMVEALVMNAGPEAGYDLIREVLVEADVKPMVNAIVYCSVLKGFCHQKRFDRVWAVYKEMQGLKLKFSLVTYNTLIDACARCREVDRIQGLLKEMARQDITPNVITYSTIMKGHCQENRLDKAFELLEKMKQTQGMCPDDFTYNTLLDGCAMHGFLDRGIAVLEDMQRSGVRPSNFTLSLAAKLGNRGCSVDAAFQLCQDIARKYGLSWNVHVYNNLLHACTAHKDVHRALRLFSEMVSAGVRPDLRTYTLLLKGLISAGEAEEAAVLLRAAHGLPAYSPRLGPLSSTLLAMREGLPQDLVEEVMKTISHYCGNARMAELLTDLRHVPGFKISPKFAQQWPLQVFQMQ